MVPPQTFPYLCGKYRGGRPGTGASRPRPARVELVELHRETALALERGPIARSQPVVMPNAPDSREL